MVQQKMSPSIGSRDLRNEKTETITSEAPSVVFALEPIAWYEAGDKRL